MSVVDWERGSTLHLVQAARICISRQWIWEASRLEIILAESQTPHVSLPPASLLKTSNGFISVFNKEPFASEPWLGLTAEVL